MIGALKGTVLAKNRNPLILMVGDVGYAVSVPQQLWNELHLGDKVLLYVYTYVREDALNLYGFNTPQDLELFELLQTVSGIGPRTAITIIDRGASAIQKAVAGGDVEFFTTIPRLGKKNAQKIIIELKNKLGAGGELDLSGEATSETKEIIEALLSMGFGRQEAIGAIKNLDASDATLAQKIKHALKLLAKPA